MKHKLLTALWWVATAVFLAVVFAYWIFVSAGAV